MWKTFLLLAVTANLFFITVADKGREAKPTSSSTGYATASAFAVCDDDDEPVICEGLNEVYDVCPAKCPPQKCGVDITLILCEVPPQLGDSRCDPGCVCINDYVRNSFNVCIPRDQCEPQCGQNERYEKCPATLCGPQKCSEIGYGENCTALDENAPCPVESACVCEDGYVRDYTGVCIPRKQCPSCKGDPNAEAGCGVYCNKRCSSLGQEPQACILLCYSNSCDCKDGYYLDENTGKCVLPEDCTKECGKNEVFSECINGGCEVRNCSQLGYPVPCVKPKKCIKGCVCKSGYLRNDKGVCVRRSHCPSCGGDENAMPGCGGKCKRCSNYNKEPLDCPPSCILNGCDCKKGYVYDENIKKCVRPENCTPYCSAKKNEVYSECINGGCQAKNCSQLGKPIPCIKIDAKSCIKGCLCKEGYLRASNGTCVPQDQCNPCKGSHEYYDTCPVLCPPQTCESIGKIYSCPMIPTKLSPQYCKPACRCQKGYYRNKIGECIAKDDCLQCTGPHEYFSCGSACDNVCKTIEIKNKTVCPIINVQCNNQCYCEDGYARAKNGTCIAISSCKEPQCGVNEQYEKCPQLLCRALNCTQVGFPIACPAIAAGSKCPDTTGCVCISGYARNKKGVCVPLDQCPACRGDPNARSGCGFCGQRCSDIGKDVACTAICEANGCQCKKGYYYDDAEKKCVLPKNCTPQCGENEQYSKCPAGLCRPQNCSQLGEPIPCSFTSSDSECTGKPGCVCNEGYVRNDTGVCIPVSQCPSCGGDSNATSGCGNCGRRCSDIGNPAVPCPLICQLNGCQCKNGYYYDNIQKKCVLPDDCTPTCGKNEVESNCVNGGCDRRNCTQLGQPRLCIDPIKCKKGCVCKEGYLRDDKQVCVPIKQCPSCGGDPNAQAGCGTNCNKRCSDIGKETRFCTLQCKEDGCDCKDGYYLDDRTGKCVKPENCSCPNENEVFDLCPYSCPPRTCESLDRAYICPIETGEDKQKCKPACRCKDGYYRNINGQCNTEAECRQCNGPHEYFNCGGACDNVCTKLSQENQTNCPRVNIVCNKMCYCEKDYARAKNNTCIPISKCNEPQCSENQVYEKNPSQRCRPETCSDLGYPLDCEDDSDEPRCVCRDGYVKNKKGVCIPASTCPSCAGDPNAKPGCGFCFTKQCPGHGEGIYCAAVCNANGCVCKENYLYDRQLNQCVALKDCTKICPKNEIPTDCVNGGCGKRHCSQLGKPDICIDVQECIKGCICKKGYLRNNKGICVPINKCPSPCGKNEILHNCTEGFCDAKTCDELGYPVPCPDTEVCTKGCLCKPGYVRNENNTCVPKSQCPSCGGDSNSTSGCGVYCGTRCRDIGKSGSKCLKICYPNACDCKSGFYLDENINKCVSPEDCTPQCSNNEIYNTCIQGHCKPKNCSDVGFPVACPRIDPKYCIAGCLCVEGYVRDQNGTCIPAQQCPSCRGDSNAQAGCGVNCNKRCSDIGKEVGCIDICYENACDCKDGFFLDDTTGKCVTAEECPSTCPKDEVYNSCVEGDCSPKKCSQVGFPIKCPRIDPSSCTGGCLCKEGYARAENETCIPIKECPSCGGDSNAVSGCGVHCNRRCRDIGKENNACIDICGVNSCDCKPGLYYDENTEKCVKAEDCSPVCGDDEVYSSCVQGQCLVKNCSQLGFSVSCPRIDPAYCIKGCLCKGDKVRADNGTCIPKDQCPSCGGDPNAVAGCGTNCNKLCTDVDQNPKQCNDTCEPYVNRCDCKEGYKLDPNSKKCVLPDQCTTECTLPNEFYDPCPPPSCPPQTCSSIGKIFHCPRVLVKGKPICKGACRCKKNYYRNLIGECISRENCLKCNGSNEYFSCGTPCDTECAKLSTQDKNNCPIKNKKCTERCYCEDGYARNRNNTCVPISERNSPLQNQTTTPPLPSANVTELLEKLRRANIALTGQFIYDLVNSKPGESFVLSAISVLIIFAQLLLYSKGLTREQLLRVTNLNDNQEVKDVIPVLLNSFKDQNNVTFEVAIKCYGNINYPFSPTFLQDSVQYFESESENLDFSKNVMAADTMNQWVENKTHGEIKDLIPASALNARTRLVLINAMYYKGDWKYPFNVKNTKNRDFYVTPNKTISLPTMYQENTFNYCEFAPLDTKVLQMFYENTDFSFLIWLPNKYDGLNDMVDKMRDPDLVTQSIECLRSERVQVYVPKMYIYTHTDMVDLAKKANVTEMFDPRSDGFDGMLKNEEPVYISDAIQKCKIQSDEKGTVAAVATGVVVSSRRLPLPPPEPIVFNANRPYMYCVKRDISIFCGIFYN